MENIIEIENLSKTFKIPKKSKNLSSIKKRLSWFYREWEEKKAVTNISFNVKKGEILGYLGPNGAGKSTSIKMLTGILYPTIGKISINLNGRILDPQKNRNKYTQDIGVVFGQRSILAYDIPVKDSFKLFKAIYGLTDEFYKSRLKYLIKMLGVDKFFEVPYRMLSLGEKMRCELAASFLHKPQIVFLDEPTIGLDAQAKITIRNFLREINKKENTTIIITTHDMDDIEELCKRIILIDEGEIQYNGDLTHFQEKYANWKLVNIYIKKVKDKRKFNKLKKDYSAREIGDDKNVSFKIPLTKNLGKFLSDIVSSVELIDLSITMPKLENVIAKVYSQIKRN
jgi:ABC-2 type transport system ATP-binding protein